MKTNLFVLLTAFVLSACGGGGGGGDAPTAVPSIEGFYKNNANPEGAGMLVEADGQFWGAGSSNGRAAAQVGSVKVSGESFSGTGTNAGIVGLPTFNFSVTGSFKERTSLTMNIDGGTFGKKIGTFTYDADYLKTLNLPAKTYKGTTITSDPISLTLAANNTFFGTTNGCNFDGILTDTGKNYKRISLTYHGGRCVLGTSTVVGVILQDTDGFAIMLKNSSNQIVIAIVQ